MPTTRPYPQNHYPEEYARALEKAVAEPGVWHTAAVATNGKDSEKFHRKLKAMMTGYKKFPGQDARVTAAVTGGRIAVKKLWFPAEGITRLSVRLLPRPSEEAEGYLQRRMEYLQSIGQVLPSKD